MLKKKKLPTSKRMRLYLRSLVEILPCASIFSFYCCHTVNVSRVKCMFFAYTKRFNVFPVFTAKCHILVILSCYFEMNTICDFPLTFCMMNTFCRKRNLSGILSACRSRCQSIFTSCALNSVRVIIHIAIASND